MHIPDGFLATPVWLGLDVLAAPAAGWLARRAERGLHEGLAPRLGVLGAVVFAAQMINFPVAAGTSSHLIGSALLAATVGPAAAALVMTAILAIQALVFQDGGLLALGANVTNMALAGVLAASIPLRYWPGRAGLFLAGAASVFTASSLAIVELRLSGVAMSAALLQGAVAVFAISALLEGLITLAVAEALERLQPGWTHARRLPGPQENRLLAALGAVAVVLASAGALLASSLPDGLEKFAENLGIAERAHGLLPTPLADYEWQGAPHPVAGKVAAGLAGLVLIYAASRAIARLFAAGGGRSAP
ncbi:MAG: energy-coupling factor ABC transporter permease [Bryobacterales bacterium]|nr:energy-coupling factor ABC transporter permease [Bryobacterales bacterium]